MPGSCCLGLADGLRLGLLMGLGPEGGGGGELE